MLGDFHLGFFIVGVLFFGRAILACVALERIPFLLRARLDGQPDELDVALVARGTPAAVEQVVEALELQSGVRCRVLLIDDRSDAADAVTLRAIAARHASVELHRIDTTPAGALPFGHAIAQALPHCRGEFVLLMQEAVLPRVDDAVARALATARAARAGSLWILHRPRCGWLWPTALGAMGDALPALASVHRGHEALAVPLELALHRTETLRATFARPDALRAAVPERLIAETCRHRKLPVRVAHAGEEFSALRRSRLGDLAEGAERGLASFGFKPALLAAITALYALMWFVAATGPFHANAWGLFAAGGLASAAVPAVLIARLYRAPILAGLLTPLANGLEILTMAFVTLRIAIRRGTRWRGIFVSLSDLRRAPRAAEEEPKG